VERWDDNLPWFYIPTWILISTPLLQLAGFILGIISLVITTGTKIKLSFSGLLKSISTWLNAENLGWLVVVGSMLSPLLAVIFLRSVLYNAWRQMFFIYPSFVLISVFGIKALSQKLSMLLIHQGWSHLLVGSLLLAGLSEPILFTLKNHPNENVFFNIFAGDPSTLRQNFEQDYWGLSYRQGIDYILAHDSSQVIHLAIETKPGREYIQYMLPLIRQPGWSKYPLKMRIILLPPSTSVSMITILAQNITP
jgi:hypothetical protein